MQVGGVWGHDDIVTLLIHNGADVNKKSSNETFPLGYACSKLQPHIVEILLRNGTVQTQWSETFLDGLV